MKNLKRKLGAYLAIVALAFMFTAPDASAGPISDYVLEKSHNVLMVLNKVTSVTATIAQAVYYVQNIENLGLAGIIGLANLFVDLDALAGGFLGDLVADLGITEFLDDISAGIKDIFGDIDIMGIAGDIMSGDYFGALLGAVDSSLGLSELLGDDILNFIGPVLNGVIDAAISGGDIGAVLEAAGMQLVNQAISFAIEQGSLLLNEAIGVIAEELQLNEIFAEVGEVFNTLGEFGIDILGVLPSPEQLVTALINGDNIGSMFESMGMQLLSQVQAAGIQLAQQAIDQAIGTITDEISKAIADSEFLQDVAGVIQDASAIVGEVAGVVNDVTGVIGEVTGLAQEVAGALGIDASLLANMPGFADALQAAVGGLNLPADVVNMLLGGSSSINQAFNFGSVSASASLSGAGGSVNIDIDNVVQTKFGFNSSVKEVSPYVLPPTNNSGLSAAYTSGNAGAIKSAHQSDIKAKASTGDPIKDAENFVALQIQSQSEAVAHTDHALGSSAAILSTLNDEGLLVFDVQNKAIQEGEDVRTREMTANSIKVTSDMQLSDLTIATKIAAETVSYARDGLSTMFGALSVVNGSISGAVGSAVSGAISGAINSGINSLGSGNSNGSDSSSESTSTNSGSTTSNNNASNLEAVNKDIQSGASNYKPGNLSQEGLDAIIQNAVKNTYSK